MTRPKVVLLTKDNRLGRYLEQQLASRTNLVATIHETRQDSIGHRFRHARSLFRQVGMVEALDILGYELHDRVFRARELTAVCDAVLPMPGADGAAPVPRHTFASLNAPEAHARLAELQPDVIVVHATGILAPSTFGMARRLAMNLHCGVLPEYRGHASTFWAMQRGDVDNVGVSIHEVAAKVDTGRLLRVGRVPLGPEDTDMTAWIRAFRRGVDLVVDVIEEMERTGDVTALPPAGPPGPHYGRRRLSDHLRFVLGWRRPTTQPKEPR
jgi:hypothetical protein